MQRGRTRREGKRMGSGCEREREPRRKEVCKAKERERTKNNGEALYNSEEKNLWKEVIGTGGNGK